MALVPITEPVRAALLALIRNGGLATYDQCRSTARKTQFDNRTRALTEYNLAVDTGLSADELNPEATRLYRITPAGLIAYLTGYFDLDWKTTPPPSQPTYAAAEQELVAMAGLVAKMKRAPTWPVKPSTSPPTPSAAGGSSPAEAGPSSSRRPAGGGSSRSTTRTTTTSGSTSGSRRR